MLARDDNGRIDSAGVEALLRSLTARQPSKVEEMAVRAFARGNASAGQQRMAFKYLMELGGGADMMFDPLNERLTAFRLGSQAVAQAMCTLAGAAWFVVPSHGESAEIDQEEGTARGH